LGDQGESWRKEGKPGPKASSRNSLCFGVARQIECFEIDLCGFDSVREKGGQSMMFTEVKSKVGIEKRGVERHRA
jgi:hypothetical protein